MRGLLSEAGKSPPNRGKGGSEDLATTRVTAESLLRYFGAEFTSGSWQRITPIMMLESHRWFLTM